MFSTLRLCGGLRTSQWRWKVGRQEIKAVKSAIKRNEPKNGMVQCLPLSLGRAAIKISAGVGALAALRCTIAHCDASKLPNRTVGTPSHVSNPEFDWNLFWELLRPYMRELLAAIVAALACAALSIYIPRILGDLINVVATHTTTGSATPFLSDIKKPATRMLGLYALLSAFTFAYIHLLSKIGEGIASSMKINLFNNILRQDIAFFDSHRTGELVNRLTVDVTEFKSAFKMVVSQGLRNVAQVFGCAVTLLSISPQMTALMLVSVPTVILTATLLGTFLRKLSFDAKAQGARLALLADEALANMRTVRVFAMENFEADLFAEEAEKNRSLNERLGIGIAAFQAGTSFFLNGMVLSTIYVGGRLLSEQLISPGDLMAYLVALQMLQKSFTQLSLLFGTYIKGIHAGARAFEMTNVKPRMNLDGGEILPNLAQPGLASVQFRGVTFAYPTRTGKNSLQNFTLDIPAGKTVALVGSSGSGKSTVCWLLERLYDPQQGSVMLGGTDIKKLSPSWLRGRVLGLISQEPVLFATSVRENIRYGRPDATDAEVEEAAHLANAHEFIARFPDGYDTIVGERGVAVSGGQKQRIAIARAVLKDPAVLILDEATSALDSESEHLVQAALENVMKRRTTIVIAHRLSTIQNADIIVVLSNGSIVETGTHKQLMSQRGVYAGFVEQQRLAGQK